MYVYSPPLFFILQLVGLLPVSVNYLPLRGDVVRYSRSRVISSTVMAIIMCVFFWGWIQKTFLDEGSGLWNNMLTATSVVTNVCGNISSFLAALVCAVVAICRADKKILLLEKLREVDFLLQRKAPSYNTRLVSYLGVTFIFTLLISDLIINHNYFDFSGFVAFLSFKVLVMCGLVEFMELVFSVKDRFQLVNQRVVELVVRRRSKQLLWTVAIPCVETFATPQEMTMRVPGLSRTHWILCCVVNDINAIYGCQSAVIMLFIFSHLVFFPYYLFLLCIYSNPTVDDLHYPHVTMLTLWTLFTVAQLYMLVWPCSVAVNEAKRTVAVVSKLLGSKMDKLLFTELDIFAQQLFHREVEFSAADLFTLQTSNIISVASAVTTYMAISMQFQTSPSDSRSVTSPPTSFPPNVTLLIRTNSS